MPIQLTEDVAIGEIRISANKAMMFTIPSLSSAIAVVMYDKKSVIGGVAHILLPDSTQVGLVEEDAIGKYADTAIPALLEKLAEGGADRAQISARIAGGAQLFNFGGGAANSLNIGTRNAVAIRAALSREGVTMEKADVGGNKGRKLKFHIGLGKLLITVAGQEEYEI
ncbi:MAG: chemotaxis protein CheD [Vampirovibrionales bacterium]|nr:chemotaxis protein CheD [Vampirovibrionales bacterium]